MATQTVSNTQGGVKYDASVYVLSEVNLEKPEVLPLCPVCYTPARRINYPAFGEFIQCKDWRACGFEASEKNWKIIAERVGLQV